MQAVGALADSDVLPSPQQCITAPGRKAGAIVNKRFGRRTRARRLKGQTAKRKGGPKSKKGVKGVKEEPLVPTAKPSVADSIVPSDIGRSVKGRRSIERLFQWCVEQDRLTWANNSLFDPDGHCRLKQFQGVSLAEISKRCWRYFEIEFVRIRNRQHYAQQVFCAFKNIRKDSPTVWRVA